MKRKTIEVEIDDVAYRWLADVAKWAGVTPSQVAQVLMAVRAVAARNQVIVSTSPPKKRGKKR